MAARRLSTPGWLTEGAADTTEMAQFDVGGNTGAPEGMKLGTGARFFQFKAAFDL